MITYTAFLKRDPISIHALFSIRSSDGRYLFEKMLANTGQAGYAMTDWDRSKSPTPIGTWRLWLDPVSPGQDEGETGIGEAFPVSSGDNRSVIIDPVNPERIRSLIRVHQENKFLGSIGCAAIVDEPANRQAEYWAMSEFLKQLRKTGVLWIPYKVFF